jgi:hypothetical protein
MSLVSLQADINDRRLENGAAIVFEDQYPARKRQAAAQFDPKLTAQLKFLDMTPDELIELRKWARCVVKKSTERLLREMTLVYTLNEPRDRVTGVEFISKMQAADKYPIAGGELLDLDCIYGGLLVRARNVYVSETAVADALDRYEPAHLLNGLIGERHAA